MNARFAVPLAVALLSPSLVQAEIVLPDMDAEPSMDSSYMHPHPRLNSLVFVSAQARDYALWPSVSYFVAGAPLLMNAIPPQTAYPPVIYRGGIHPTANPSNRDNITYSLARAHAFSQDFYNKDNYRRPFSSWEGSAFPYVSGISYYPYAPVNSAGGFNQPVRPSNRDNTSYNLDRAHRYSMDAYKKP